MALAEDPTLDDVEEDLIAALAADVGELGAVAEAGLEEGLEPRAVGAGDAGGLFGPEAPMAPAKPAGRRGARPLLAGRPWQPCATRVC
jgi:hypothetical protein